MDDLKLDLFDNDDALDWLVELEEAEDHSVLLEALNIVIDASDTEYLDATDYWRALAAAEVVAALAGNPSTSLPEEVTRWVLAYHGIDAATHEKAKQAVQIIFGDYGLEDLWEEEDEFEQWQAAVNDLLERLE